MKRVAALFATFVFAVAMGACGGGKSSTTTTAARSATTAAAGATTTSAAAAAPANTEIIIKNFAYQGLAVPAGATVKVTNQDAAPHTLTSKGGSVKFDTGTINGNASGELKVPTTPG